ncbi:MAG: CHAD domain-containing protein, partial [Anaerolineae bacterium]|nr:CHAD domain-containing protein [Anaerolineae bacterium]
RYLMELFSGLYEPKEINGLIKQLRTLQGNLGDFNDLSVQEAYLMRTAAEMATRRQPTPDTLMAIGALVAALDAERAVVRGAFGDTFDAFAASENRERFKLAFGSSRDAF